MRNFQNFISALFRESQNFLDFIRRFILERTRKASRNYHRDRIDVYTK